MFFQQCISCSGVGFVTAGRLTGSARPDRLAVSAGVNKQKVRLSGGSRGPLFLFFFLNKPHQTTRASAVPPQTRPAALSRRSILLDTSASESKSREKKGLKRGRLFPATLGWSDAPVGHIRKDILGRELLDGGLRLLLEGQPGFTFAGILHHLHLHLFDRRQQRSRGERGTQDAVRHTAWSG